LLTETDDFFAHQIAESHTIVQLNDPSWAERAYFTLCDPDRFGLDIGMSMYANNNRIETYAILTTSRELQVSMRAGRDLGADRWPLSAGPVTTHIVEPLKRWHLVCEPNESGIEFDLIYTARARPHEGRSPTLRKHNRLMYDNTNMWQTGRWDGVVRLDGTEYPVDGIHGHRDRTWGVRASGEGRFNRGLLLWVAAEFEDVSVMSLVHERYNGQLRDCTGAVSYAESGELVPIVGWEHDLEFDHDTRLFQRGSVRFTDATGKVWEIEAEPTLRLFLHGGGYTSGNDRRGFLPVALWTERWDLTDRSLIPRIDGLNDQISRFRCGDRTGHGIVETLIGEHDRYRVAPQLELGEHAVV
jgi:hypothetical protein